MTLCVFFLVLPVSRLIALLIHEGAHIVTAASLGLGSSAEVSVWRYFLGESGGCTTVTDLQGPWTSKPPVKQHDSDPSLPPSHQAPAAAPDLSSLSIRIPLAKSGATQWFATRAGP